MNLFTTLVCTLFIAETFSVRYQSLCPPVTLVNGRVRYRQRGRIARFLCSTGYMLAGDRYSVCTGGKWDNVASKCVRASCKDPRPPANGLIYPSYGGAVLNFYCKTGFELRGKNITFCDGMKWDNTLPSCLPSKTRPALFCDFEQENLCGWNHDLNHDFDWTRLNYATPSGSIGTGPSYDHTKGQGKDGYYMYIESSARNVNDHARLISPVYDKTNDTVCFEFYYHMYGSTTGSLRVYLKKIDAPWTLYDNKALFVKNGNQGNKWYRGFVEIGVIDTEFQIIIEGVRGKSYVSDIAIDDVKLILNCVPENEVVEEETTTEFATSETPISVESCENRCNTNDTRNVNWLITCDCDEVCYERNRCCPDYFDFCVALSTGFDETTTDYSTTVEEIIHQTTRPTTRATTRLTTRPTTRQTTPTTPPETPFVPPKTTPATPTTLAPKLTTSPYVKKNESKIIYVKPEDSDVVEVPVEFTEESIKENEIINDYESDKSFDHQKIEVGSNTHESNTRTVVFSVGVVFGVLFALVGMTFVARRYQLFNCKRLRLNQTSNGDSQSDVRFLTSDEMLDFSLAGDYDTL